MSKVGEQMIIGLTGSIATGKSTVANMLKERGIPVVDADEVARIVVEKGRPALQKIVEAFGEEVLLEDGTLNRPALGNIIFNDTEARNTLNAIMHPAIREEMESQKAYHIQNEEPIIIMDIPLLFENRLTETVDRVVVVTVDEGTQLHRLMKRNDLTEEEAKARIQSQIPIQEKVQRADDLIDNSSTLEKTEEQVEAMIMKWTETLNR